LSDRLEIMKDVIIDVLSYWDYFVKKIYWHKNKIII
jgi:hypothetical protein